MVKRFLIVTCVFLSAAAIAQTPSWVKLGDIDIDEASGIADSRVNPGILWLHNDSGDGAYLYGVDRKGKTKAVYLVHSASNVDWEDIAWGPGPDDKGNFIYIGDIGDNSAQDGSKPYRTGGVIYRIPEPKIPESKSGAPSGSRETPLLTNDKTIRRSFNYPDNLPHDAETLLVHPDNGDIYIVTKVGSGGSQVYKFLPEPEHWWEMNTLQEVPLIKGEGIQGIKETITGGAISPRGDRVILRTYHAAYELKLPANATNFDTIWTVSPKPLTGLPKDSGGEAICYSKDGKSLLATYDQNGENYDLNKKRIPIPLHELPAP